MTNIDMIDFNKIKKIHFIGIGGTSMSGLALMSKTKGFIVTGSDIKTSKYTKKLEKHEIPVYIGHDAKVISKDIDLVVHTAAVHKDNEEMVRAAQLGIKILERSYFLGNFTTFYDKTIAVAGTHGKTTTSSFIALLLYNAGLDPSVSIGGSLDKIGGNSRVGNSAYFVTEACEFIDSFLRSRHYIATIQNIEEDHLDYFIGGIEQIKQSFKKFAQILPKRGLLIANGDDENVKEIIEGLECEVRTFGVNEGNDYIAKNIAYNSLGQPAFDVYCNGTELSRFQLNIPGKHNIQNALSVVVCAHFLDIDIKIVKQTLLEFQGAHRRFEFVGEERGIKVYEDYAHHPTELKVTIDACQNYEYNKLWVIFQPHTYSRTHYFFNQFIDAFEGADEVIMNDIYSKREENKWGITSEKVAREIKNRFSIPARNISEFKNIVSYIEQNAEKGDFVIVAGSQTINQVAYDLIERLEE